MAKRLSASFVTLVYEATLRSFWRRKALWRFLRQAGVAESFLATWQTEESKRHFLDPLFAKLPDQDKGQDLILAIARDLTQQETFPDLLGWEDSDRRVKEAREAVLALRSALTKIDEQVRSERERQEAQQRFRAFQQEVRRSRESLESLNRRLTELAGRLGSPEAGYDFQNWFYDMMDFFEIVNRRPYVVTGRQIDGSITVSGTTYLIELKFTQEQAGAVDIDTLHKKVTDKADNTMAPRLSMRLWTAFAAMHHKPVSLTSHQEISEVS
ncbi:MAG: hypothetical protein ACE5JD_09265 [Candidatus Methylomirabilia bacterium]